MSDSPNLALPFLASAQAQKHVTVNEALARLDAMVSPSVLSSTLSGPPANVAEGDRYIVAASGAGDWSGRDGDLAFWSNGGWDFASPAPGWRVWDQSNSGPLTYDGVNWKSDLVGSAIGGAASAFKLLTADETLAAGGPVTSNLTIPDKAVVFGVTGRVVDAITGAGVTSWRLGVSGGDDRYGSGMGTGLNAEAVGVTGSPQTYYGGTPLLITPEGGAAFSGGTVRLAIHYVQLTPPSAV